METAPPSSESKPSDDVSSLNVSRCDASGEPVSDPLLSTSMLQLCLNHAGGLSLQISEMSIEQGQAGSNSNFLAAQGLKDTTVVVDCHEDGCQVQVSNIPSFIFGPERPAQMNVTGWVRVVTTTPVTSLHSGGLFLRTRKLVSVEATYPVHFSITIPLKLNDEAQTNDLTSASSSGEEEEDEHKLSWPFILLWIGLALVMVSLCWCQVCAHWRESHAIEQ